MALVIASHAGMAQQANQQIDSAVPMPDTDLLPPLTAKDIAVTPDAAKVESKQDVATPAVALAPEPAKAAAAPAPAPVAVTADNAVADQLRDLMTARLD